MNMSEEEKKSIVRKRASETLTTVLQHALKTAGTLNHPLDLVSLYTATAAALSAAAMVNTRAMGLPIKMAKKVLFVSIEEDIDTAVALFEHSVLTASEKAADNHGPVSQG